MERRQFIKLISVAVGAAALSSCELAQDIAEPSLTKGLFKEESYYENLSKIYLSGDDKKLIVISTKYHYIFDIPKALVATFKTSLHQFVTGTLGEMIVDGNNKTSINVGLVLKKEAPETEQKIALDSGFIRAGSDKKTIFFNQDLHGVRYSSGGVKPPADSVALNKNYTVHVSAKLSKGQKAGKLLLTPLTITADGAVMLGAILAAAVIIPTYLIFYKYDH